MTPVTAKCCDELVRLSRVVGKGGIFLSQFWCCLRNNQTTKYNTHIEVTRLQSLRGIGYSFTTGWVRTLPVEVFTLFTTYLLLRLLLR